MRSITLRRNAGRHDITIEKDGAVQIVQLKEDYDSREVARAIFKWGLAGFPRNSRNNPEI